jgi:DNA helicase-2/ATP-dependent DNA helicase PcrA
MVDEFQDTSFVRENLAYTVSGVMSFCQRAEVKDFLAYLRVLANPEDDVSLLRIVNTPRRGIGRRTLEAVVAAALSDLAERLDYRAHLAQENPKGSVARWKMSNVESLADSLAAVEEDPDNLDPGLFQYLNRISLLTREDAQDQDGGERVQLMTIHAAKGLEFDTVFIAGVERDLIPHAAAAS